MRVGVQLPEVERVVPWPEYLAIARAAEEVGFDSVWVGDHLLYREPERGHGRPRLPRPALRRVTIGPLVACLSFHPPAVLAKMAATVAEISDGRFVLGVGAGWNEVEFRAFGIPFDHRVERFANAFDVVHALLGGERAGDAVLLPPPRRVPVMIGSNGPRMLAHSLARCDAWNTWFTDYGNTAEGFERLHTRLGITGVERSACAFVVLDREHADRQNTADAPAIESSIGERIRELGDSGADEVICVVSPITERSVRQLAEELDLGG
jgi:alkanesulfonate monooxygenase SsuD/methylene tetrahydromethanopterin reductase-like flavin-dependent oxidoreductase (luciferase family)